MGQIPSKFLEPISAETTGRIWKSLAVENVTDILYLQPKFGGNQIRKIGSFLNQQESFFVFLFGCHPWTWTPFWDALTQKDTYFAIYWWILMQFSVFLEDATAFPAVCNVRNYVVRWRHKCR